MKARRSKKLSLEDYVNFLHTEDPTRFLANHLNQIISMHGFRQIKQAKMYMIEALQHINLMVPSRSTLESSISPSGFLTLEDAVTSLNQIEWQECCISSIQTLNSSSPATVPSNSDLVNGSGTTASLKIKRTRKSKKISGITSSSDHATESVKIKPTRKSKKTKLLAIMLNSDAA